MRCHPLSWCRHPRRIDDDGAVRPGRGAARRRASRVARLSRVLPGATRRRARKSCDAGSTRPPFRGIERSIPLVFKGPSPADGPVELRASFWDLGRLPREDPRIVIARPRPSAGQRTRRRLAAPGRSDRVDGYRRHGSETFGWPAVASRDCARSDTLRGAAREGHGTVSGAEPVRRCAAGARSQSMGLRAPERRRGRLDHRHATSR